jgi:hypothetical protein
LRTFAVFAEKKELEGKGKGVGRKGKGEFEEGQAANKKGVIL